MVPKYIFTIEKHKPIFFDTIPTKIELKELIYKKLEEITTIYDDNYYKLLSFKRVKMYTTDWCNYIKKYDFKLIELFKIKNNLSELLYISKSFYYLNFEEILDMYYSKYNILISTENYLIFETDSEYFFVNEKILQKISNDNYKKIKELLDLISKSKIELENIIPK